MAKKEIKSTEVTPKEEIELANIELKNKIHDELEDLIKEFNEKSALRKIGEVVVLSSQIKTAIENLQNLCAKVAYADFAKADVPMVAAANAFRYDSYSVKEKVDKATGVVTMELKEINPIVNVLALENYCNGKACVNPDWKYKAERLHCAIMLRLGRDHGYNEEQIKQMHNSYAMTATARKFDEYKEVASNADADVKPSDPTSNNSLIKALQEIINDMIGKTKTHKIQKKDVKYMMSCYTKEGDDMDDIKICSRKDYTRILFKICAKLEICGMDSNYRYIIAKADRREK